MPDAKPEATSAPVGTGVGGREDKKEREGVRWWWGGPGGGANLSGTAGERSGPSNKRILVGRGRGYEVTHARAVRCGSGTAVTANAPVEEEGEGREVSQVEEDLPTGAHVVPDGLEGNNDLDLSD